VQGMTLACIRVNVIAIRCSGSLLLVDIEVESPARKDSLKQRF
jgi:hypothetical protein